MARLRAIEIARELRASIKTYAFTDLSFVAVPTGRDPRKFTSAETLPQLVVQLASTVTVPKSIGGGMEAFHGISVFAVFGYGDSEDPNDLKLLYAADLLEWLSDNKVGDEYKAFIAGSSGVDAAPTFDYDPTEERAYSQSDRRVAVLKMTFAVTQRQTFTI